MTPAEQNLIEDLFNRIRSLGAAGRDAEAGALINRLMLQTPDAAYALVQSVLVQDQALREADQRIRALQERQSADNQGSSGSFVGGAERQRWNASPTGPSVQPPQPQSAYSVQPQPTYGYGAPPQPAFGAPAPEAGGFMRGALQTAAGVAGGALLFEGVRSLFHGGAGGLGGLGGAAGGPWSNPETVVNETTTVNEAAPNDTGTDRSGLQQVDDSGQDDDQTGQDWTDDDTDSFGNSDDSV